MSGRLAVLVELLEGAPPHLTSCLVELICNCAELPAAREVQHLLALVPASVNDITNIIVYVQA